MKLPVRLARLSELLKLTLSIFLLLAFGGCMILNGCSIFHRPPATTWLGPSEPLDAMMLAHIRTGKTNVVIYGFRHDTETGGTLVWKMVPLLESNP